MSDVGPYIFFKSCPLKVFGSHHCVWMISFSKYIYFNSQHLKNKGKSKIKLSGLVGACWSRKLFQFCKWLSRNLIRNIFLIFQFRNNDRIQSVMTVRLIFKTFDFFVWFSPFKTIIWNDWPYPWPWLVLFWMLCYCCCEWCVWSQVGESYMNVWDRGDTREYWLWQTNFQSN